MSDLGGLLNTYLHTPNFQSVKKLIELHPILLSEETDTLLSAWIEQAIISDDIGKEKALRRYQRQLGLFREYDVEQIVNYYNFSRQFIDVDTTDYIIETFLDFCSIENWAHQKQYLNLHPELLTFSAYSVLEQEDVLDQILKEYPVHALNLKAGLIYLNVCRELGIEGAEQWLSGYTQDFLAEERNNVILESPIAPSVFAFLHANSLDTMKEIVSKQPELLTQEAEQILETLMLNASEGKSWEKFLFLSFNQTILKNIRNKSIEFVFKELETISYAPQEMLIVFSELASADAQNRRYIIDQNPVLLSPYTDATLEAIYRQLEQIGNALQAEVYQKWRLILRYCNELGVDKFFQVFDSFLPIVAELLKAETWEQIETIIEKNDLFLMPLVDLAMNEIIRMMNTHGIKELNERIEKYRELLQDCRTLGISNAVKQMKANYKLTPLPNLSESINSNLQRNIEVIAQFINAENWLEGRTVLEQNPELLSEGVDFAFAQIIDYFEDQDEERLTNIRQHWDIIRQCRKNGIEKTFEYLKEK